MLKRKIQLIAGTTYSISLPKEWIKKNNLKEKNELIIHEKNDKTLFISPEISKEKDIDKISLNIDEYEHNIDQILFAVYYLGIEEITLFSNKDLKKETRSRIIKTLTNMSGTEVSYEDQKKIIIKVLLDKSKVNITQMLYRIVLIIKSSISNILDKIDITEIKINENEIDRLYHLITKIISLSQINSKILNTSKIKNSLLIPSFFLMGKKLENIADHINHLSIYLNKSKKELHNKQILKFITQELDRSINKIIGDNKKVFEKIEKNQLTKIKKVVEKIEDNIIKNHLKEMIKYTVDLEEEIVNISFYKELFKNKFI